MKGNTEIPAWVLIVVMAAGIVVGLTAVVGPVEFADIQRLIGRP